MKLLRYGAAGKEKPGMLDKDGKIRDLSAVVGDISGEVIGPKGLARLKKIKPESLPLVRGKPRIGACIANPQKFIAIGLNFSDHAADSGLSVPKIAPRSPSAAAESKASQHACAATSASE